MKCLPSATIVVLLTCLFCPSSSRAQATEGRAETNEVAIPSERAKIIEPITRLFAGMLASDTTGLTTLFHPSAKLMSVMTDPKGIRPTQLRETPIDDFIASLAGTRAGQLREELHHTEVRVDGELATAWTPYTFYYQDQISHCGVNAFQLAKTGKGGSWQIIRITDSRRKDDCPEKSTSEPASSLDDFASRWHRAAAETEAHIFFGSMAKNAVYIGTDAGEHWTKEEFYTFAKPYFDKGKAWDFTATERHVFIVEDENIAYWDELLDTWMGPCRGTGIVKRDAAGNWQLLHYTLSVTVPNEKIQAFIELTKD